MAKKKIKKIWIIITLMLVIIEILGANKVKANNSVIINGGENTINIHNENKELEENIDKSIDEDEIKVKLQNDKGRNGIVNLIIVMGETNKELPFDKKQRENFGTDVDYTEIYSYKIDKREIDSIKISKIGNNCSLFKYYLDGNNIKSYKGTNYQEKYDTVILEFVNNYKYALDIDLIIKGGKLDNSLDLKETKNVINKYVEDTLENNKNELETFITYLTMLSMTIMIPTILMHFIQIKIKK